MTVLPISAGAVGRLPRDRREVERRDRVDEPLERPVLQSVPHRVAADRLLLVELLRVVRIEPPEVDHLRRRVDLRLEHVLRLPQHRRRVQRGAPGRRQQFRGAKEHRRALVPGPARPLAARLERRRDRLLDVLRLRECHSPSTCRWLCGITDCSTRPVRISLPPMTSGMSIRSAAICASRAFSSARSGEPGR